MRIKILMVFMVLALRLLFADHPRLFVTPERIAEIRSAIQVEGSTHKEAYDVLKARVGAFDWREFEESLEDNNWNYARSYTAQAAALMYLITEDTVYSNFAYDVLVQVHSDPDPDRRLPEENYGLSRATVGRGFGMAYDWCYHAWSDSQRTYIKDKIDLALDAWTSYSHANLNASHRGSNWVAVCRGGELVMMLAAEEEVSRARRFQNLKSWLQSHIMNGYGDIGFSQEGVGYTCYAGIFLLPAVYALQSTDDNSLNFAFYNTKFWKQLMYSGPYAVNENGHRRSLQNGVTHDVMADQGWVSLLLESVPDDSLAFYKYFYDQHTGIDAIGPVENRYDPMRAGTMWALLYYPESLSAINPNGRFPRAVRDQYKGAYFFRNRWQDENDILISIMSDTDHHSHAWDQSEGFQLNLFANNTRFAGGPGKEYANADVYSMLLVDGLATEKRENGSFKNGLTCNHEYFNATKRGGYVIADGGEKYNELGVEDVKRHFIVDFHNTENKAFIGCLDRISKVKSPTCQYEYNWQLNLGNENDDDGITVELGTENGVNTFILKGRNNGYVKGWVLAPRSDVTLEKGDPLRVNTKGQKKDIWIAMHVGAGEPPAGIISGTDLNTTLQVEHQTMTFDSESGQMKVDTDLTKVESGNQPADFQLGQNYPNPFNGITYIPYVLRQPVHARLSIFDSLGRHVQTLIDRVQDAGRHHTVWQGVNAQGETVSSGIYFYQLQTNKYSEKKKLLYIK